MGTLSLSQVTRGRVERPVRVLLYGVEGIGKSTFGGDAPSAVFLGAEDGTSELDVSRLPPVSTWSGVIELLDLLRTDPHTYRTLVVDTLDWLEPLVWTHVCATKADKAGQKHKSIEDYGYGAGYAYAVEVWRDFLARLDALRAKGMNIILIAHSHVKQFKNPEGEDFDRYEPKIHKLATALISEWCDAMMFAQLETLTAKSGAGITARHKGVSGARLLFTERRAAFAAKNRYSLPEALPLSWQAFHEAVAARRTMPTVDLRERIAGLLSGQPEALSERVNKAVADAGEDAQKLAKILNHLSATVTPKEKSA